MSKHSAAKASESAADVPGLVLVGGMPRAPELNGVEDGVVPGVPGSAMDADARLREELDRAGAVVGTTALQRPAAHEGPSECQSSGGFEGVDGDPCCDLRPDGPDGGTAGGKSK